MKLFYEPIHHLLLDKWTANTEQMTEEEFKKLIILRLRFVKEKNIKIALTDTKEFAFPIHPDLQKWIIANSNTLEKEYGLQKHSFVMPEDFITHLGMGQFVSEVDERQMITIAYFSDLEKARHWLIS